MNEIKNYGHGIILMVILFSCVPIFGQNLEVTYTESLQFDFGDHGDDPEMEQLQKSTVKSKTLIYTDGKSLYSETAKEHIISNEEMTYFISGEIVVAVFKDQRNSQIIKELDLYSRHFIIKTVGAGLSWKIEPEQKKIDEYLCRKAVGMLDTITVTAWYSEQIPVNDGPDIFWGLPGLILEVNLGNNARVIKANKITFTKTNPDIAPPANGKEVSEADYRVIRDKKYAEMKAGGGKIRHTQTLNVD